MATIYAVLIQWTETPWRPRWEEVIGGFGSASEAESVAKEARRLGAESAAVMNAKSKLVRNAQAKLRQMAEEEAIQSAPVS